MTKQKPTFEEAFERLGEIVETLESGEITLDESFRLWSDGMRMAEVCRKQLADSEKKIEKLIEAMDGAVSTEPMDSEEGGGDA